MNPDAPPRKLNERTQKHKCIKCLAEVPAEEYFANDYLCNKCAEREEDFPLQSTEKDEGKRMKDE
jgi:hypothetical protein